jgi:outer membrane murein-binding lipoprotein Lpp
MNKKLNNILENEIKRFNTIIAYQDKMTLTEGSYKFYNEADEPGTEEAPVDDAPPVDAAVDGTEAPATDGAEGTDGLNDPDMGAEAPATDGTETPDMGGDEDVTEIDVTDLVNDTNEIKGKISSIEGNLSKMDAIMSKVDNLATNVSKMDSLVQQMTALAQQVELMRPPTEAERRKALAKDSYPFNVSIDQYNNGEGVKTQTDLENKPNKMSMLDNLMADYNDSAVKNSFYAPQENQLTKK